MITIPQAEALRLFLATIAGNDRVGFVEVRARRAGGGMNQTFHRTDRLQSAAELITALGQRTDVYVGMAPRTHRHGGADAVSRVWTLWVDADEPAAVHALSAFDPAPSIIIKSGGITDGVPHVHAAWQLREPLAGEHAERANRRLAHALGADPRSCDRARILRPPATLSHKHGGRPVEAIRMAATTFTARELVGELLDPPTVLRPCGTFQQGQPRQLDTEDPLHAIPATEYVPALLGVELSRDGKVPCPWHGDDSTPSLHVYADDGGWCCFGCEPRRGGTIVDFGACLYNITPRGRGFHDIRRQLARDLLGSIEAVA